MKKLLCIVLVLSCLFLVGCKSSDYREAVSLQENGYYEDAIALFMSIKDYENYKDTAERIEFCQAYLSAKGTFENSVKALQEKNRVFDDAVLKSREVIENNKFALDMELFQALETQITLTNSQKTDVFEMPAKTEDILDCAAKMDAVDYTEILADLGKCKIELEKSIHQYNLVNNPTEKYVIDCIRDLEHIDNFAAVTEDNDPNGQLNKAGGYTSTVYWQDNRITGVYGDTIIERGTQGGGAIEVYSTVEDAEARNAYLAAFDGSFISSGSHCVIGTVVIRTSDKLTASQQKEMENLIISALTYIDE